MSAGTGGREEWNSRLGFIFATVGAAAGLGNIWRFSYVAGENGGAAFLVVYFFCVLFLGLPVIIAEIAIGRRGRGDAVAAFRASSSAAPWMGAGFLAVAAGFLILAYYSVVAGWALKYLVGALGGVLWREAAGSLGGYFRSFIANPWEPVLWQFAMLGVTVLVVAAGVRRGIEALNSVLIPALAVIVVLLALFGLTLPGAGGGLEFLFAPDWSAFANPRMYLAAVGQAFFSLGVGMAIFLTYGSYLPRLYSIPSAAAAIVIGDTLIAVIAGIAIFTAVFSFGLDPAAGPELAFITLPQVFLAMPGGKVVAPVFFALLVGGAVTSMVSMLEVPTVYFARRFRLSRRIATVAVGLVSFAIGIPASLGFGILAGVGWNGRGILDSMDYLVSNLILPLGALMTALFVGWTWRRAEALAESDFGAGLMGSAWLWVVRVVVPALIVLIFVRAALDL